MSDRPDAIIYVSRSVYDELQMAPFVWCPSCRIIIRSETRLTQIHLCECGTPGLDWNDMHDLEDQGKLKWLAPNGLMAEWATLLLTEDGA